MSYSEYLKTEKWSNIRELVLQRDNNKCRHCNKVDNLHIHHLTYANIYNEEDNLSDLITLCSRCHSKEHGIRMVGDLFSVKVDNNILLSRFSNKPSGSLLFLIIIKLLQDNKYDYKNGYYIFDRDDISIFFNPQMMQKNKFDKVIDDLNDTIKDIYYDKINLFVMFSDNSITNFKVSSNYTLVDLSNLIALKSSNVFNILKIIFKYQNTGFASIKLDSIKGILGNNDSIQIKTLNRDIKNAICIINNMLGLDLKVEFYRNMYKFTFKRYIFKINKK